MYIGPVRLTITLDNLYKRLAAILAVTGIGLGLGWTVVSNFIVRAVEDNRLSFRREWLTAAVDRFPNSARVNFQLAKSRSRRGRHNGRFDASGRKPRVAGRQSGALGLPGAQSVGHGAGIERQTGRGRGSLRAAVKLAPNHGRLNWAFANLLLRRGNLSESFGPFRIAARSRADLLAPAIDTIWRSSDGGLEALKSFAGNDAEAMLAVAKFLTEQNLVAEARRRFQPRLINRRKRVLRRVRN